ncbi:FtsX-like permease family protein [Ekhidna sp.]
MNNLPPGWVLHFLRWFCRKDHLEEIEGDLFEIFDIKSNSKSYSYAKQTFLFDVLKFFRWSNFKKPIVMKYSVNKGLWNHNLKISLRVLKKNLLFSGINISGLVLGITAFLILLLYYFQENSYDTFFPDHEKIYRIAINSQDDGQYQESAKSPVPLIDLYQETVSQEATYSRLMPWPGYLKYGADEKKKENQIVFADESVFSIFPLTVVKGSLNSAMNAPFQLVITERKASQYFGEENPIGKTLSYDEGSGEFEFNIVAVIKDLPFNTHFNFDFIASFKSLDQIIPWHDNWFYPSTYLYAKFENQGSVEVFGKTAQKILEERGNPNYVDSQPEVILQPVTNIHLSSNRQGEWKSNNTQIDTNFFLALGIFILLIAVINYVNLTTANGQQRTKEIGIKKAMGSDKGQLLKQFFLESFLMITVSILLSGIFLFLLWNPVVSQLLDKSILTDLLANRYALVWLVSGALILTGISGVYPAFTSIRYNSIDVIRNNLGKYMTKGVQRKVLVTVQFSISMFLILFTMLLIRQYYYLQTKNIGFEKDYVVALKMLDDHDAKNYETLKRELKNLSFVEEVAVSSTLIGLGQGFYGFTVKFPEYSDNGDFEWFTLGVDEDYFKTFDIELIVGRNFSEEFKTDERQAFILNKAAAEQMGTVDEVLGKEMELTVYTGRADNRKGKVIGVVENFHFQSLYESVKPLVIYINKHQHYTDYLNVKLTPESSIVEQINAIDATYSAFNKDKPMELTFIEDEIKRTYQRELAGSKIMTWFTILSIFIASLGAFGLATYSFRRRTKEIGVRKVLGASAKDITLVLTKEYLMIIIISCLISWPVSYYLSQQWLNTYAYSINFGIADYLLGLLILIMVIILSNLQQILWSIKLRPVDYLRDE